MITLYGHPISGNAHRVATFLSILGLEHTYEQVDLKAGAHKSPDYLSLNAMGQIPVLCDDDLVLRDSIAILVYLARRYDPTDRWLPADAQGQAKVQQWLSTAVNDLQSGPASLRAIKLFGAPLDFEGVKLKTENVLGKLFEPHLAKQHYLVGDEPTLADIACYSYIARVTDGDYNLDAYTAIQHWLARVEGIHGFAPMIKASDLA